jgi:hypothetical protein
MTRLLVLLVLLLSLAQPAFAQGSGIQMPDPKQMSGVPLPTGDLPVGTITVRVIRGSLTIPILNQVVQITGGATASSTTNESGRAEFSGLTPGTRIKAFTEVDGERVESQEIQIPAAGGVRVMLVATDPEAAKRAEEDRRLAQTPAQPGMVVLGDQSRFVFEVGDEGLNVFNILQVINTARVPIQPDAPVRFQLPDGAERAALLEGSTPLASVAGKHVEVKGPFPPGMTLLQFAYTMPYSGGTLTVRQAIPAQLAQLTVVAQKVGDMRLTSAQIAQQREMPSEGQLYILGQGPAIPLGGAVEFAFSGLPHRSTWPRNVALSLVVLILIAGAITSTRGRGTSTPEAARRTLEDRRERLFDELVQLEQSHRAGRLAPGTYSSRRQQLVNSLERIYAALDDEAAA